MRDDAYAAGPAGIRVNSICRLRDIRVSTWEEGQRVYLSRLDAQRRELEEVREAVPRPVLWRSYAVPTGARVHFFRPQEQGPPRLLVVGATDAFRGFRLQDLDGKVLWETPAKEGPGSCKFADVDGDGIKEIVSFIDGGIAVHRSTDGQQVAWGPLPGPGPYDQNRERPSIHLLYPAALYTPGRFDSVIVFDQCGSAGGWDFWVLDASLQVRFMRTVQLPPMGHNLNIHDVNGDGREG